MQFKEQDSSYDGRDVSKVFVPFPAMQRDFPNGPPSPPHTIDQMLVAPASLEQHEECKWQIKRGLGRIHSFNPNDKEAVPIWDTVENLKQFQHMTDGMKYFLGAVGIVTLFLGGIGVMNVMMVAVRERTREIGVRKAVGATSRSILTLFFVEAMMIVFLSGGVGLSVAYGLCAAVNMLPDAAVLRRSAAHLADVAALRGVAGPGGGRLGDLPGQPCRFRGSDRGAAFRGRRLIRCSSRS